MGGRGVDTEGDNLGDVMDTSPVFYYRGEHFGDSREEVGAYSSNFIFPDLESIIAKVIISYRHP